MVTASSAPQPAQTRQENSRGWIYSFGLWHGLIQLRCFQHLANTFALHVYSFWRGFFTSLNSSRCRNFQSCLDPRMRMCFSRGIKKPSCSCFLFKFSIISLKSQRLQGSTGYRTDCSPLRFFGTDPLPGRHQFNTLCGD